MDTPVAKAPDEIARCKSEAARALQWINAQIDNASEDYIKALVADPNLTLSRTALGKMKDTGEKISASVLHAIDTARLNKLHLAFAYDPSNADARREASEWTMQASRLLNLENTLIDYNMVQYTVTPDATRIGTQSRYNRGRSAAEMLEIIHELRNGIPPQHDMANEPMVRAFVKSLEEVGKTGDPIDVCMAMDLSNNANSKLRQGVTPSLTDAAGTHPYYFSEQASAYHKLATLAQSKELFHGLPSDPHRSRG